MRLHPFIHRLARSEYRPVVLVWLCWAVVFLLIVQYLPARFHLYGPDTSLGWTASQTLPGQGPQSSYLSEAFLNGHVSWDSEYYLSIAQAGYEDPAMRAISPSFSWSMPLIQTKSQQAGWISLNYAFWPGYPFAMRAVMTPFSLLGMPDLAAAALAGVLVSMLGTLAGMIGLYRLGRGLFDRDGGARAAFYLLIMPASLFLGMVYTEGMFLGLSFLSLALAREGRFVPAGILAFGAAFTKAAGAFLLVPLVLYWWRDSFPANPLTAARPAGLRRWRNLAFACLPALAYLIFLVTMSENFHLVESAYFSRGLLAIDQTIAAWSTALGLMAGNPASAAYYLVELACLAAGVISLVLLWRHDRILVLYGAIILVFSLTSGVAQGMHRYVLALPSLCLVAGKLGRSPVFDRGWILANLPFMLIFLTGFVFDQWAG